MISIFYENGGYRMFFEGQEFFKDENSTWYKNNVFGWIKIPSKHSTGLEEKFINELRKIKLKRILDKDD